MKSKRIIISVSILLTAALAGLAFITFTGGDSLSGAHSKLTGKKISSEEADRPILGVIIENTEPARPQLGLNNAGIVFEAVTEGGITRYLALYQEDQPEIVGPVRSLRADTLDWAMGFDASIAHVGGRPKALDLAKERDAKSMTQFEYGEPYYRDEKREAPHNMYARTEALRNLQKELGHKTINFDDIPRSEDNPTSSPKASRIGIDYSSPEFKVEFRYDSATNSYVRYLAGSPHVSGDASDPINVKNVIVITLSADRTTDDGALGKNKALVFKDGEVIEAQWEQSDYDSRIKVLDGNNNEIELNRGKTWISALESSKTVTY